MNYKIFFSTIFSIAFSTLMAYYVPDEGRTTTTTESEIDFRVDCVPGRSQEDLDINNVRARLRHSGSLFWDASGNARYIVPKVDPASGQEEVSSIFAGGIWLGGLQEGNIRSAISLYGINQGNVDWYPGPLDPVDGSVQQSVCADWDKHFVVFGREISDYLAIVNEADFDMDGLADEPLDPSVIPEGVLGWPARGNVFFRDVHDFDLPLTDQGLAGFRDVDEDGIYDPTVGDYPIIEIRDCPEGIFPDMMVFWIFNDNGNTHLESNGEPIRMEVQVQSFAFSTTDEINDMTFYRYKLINRAPQVIDSMYFANWADPDLGCSEDDYIGCDTTSSVGYVYNADAVDGSVGTNCPVFGTNVPTYGNSPPMLGIDYFRGPLGTEGPLDTLVPCAWVSDTELINVFECTECDENGNKRCTGTIIPEFGMSSFIYNSRAGTGCDAATIDPVDAQDAYRYLSGTWNDGTPVTRGGDGVNRNDPLAERIRYVFPDSPHLDEDGIWSMCCPNAPECSPLPDCDFRFIQASGPLVLVPGAINELIVGVVWIPEADYPCPNIRPLLEADVAAQGLFDNCFDLLDGPEAPDMNIIELDREVILTLNNPDCSNNFQQGYAERDIFAPEDVSDSLGSYLFEGYTIYQLVNANVGLDELNNTDLARVVANVDIRNGISDIFNWTQVPHPNPDSPSVFVPELQVESQDAGIDNAFRVTEDRFAEGDTRLINHRKYYYLVLAYAYNNYTEFDEERGSGQSRLYIQGRQSSCGRPLQVYTAIPRPLTQQTIVANFGDQAQITRVDGEGAGGQFLQITAESQEAIVDGTNNGEVVYQEAAAPIIVEVFNPLKIVDGTYSVRIVDNNLNDDFLAEDAIWELYDESGSLLFRSMDGIAAFNQVLLKEFGFAVSLGQTDDVSDAINVVGTPRNGDPNLGTIGGGLEYADPDGAPWFIWWPDSDELPGIDVVRGALDYMATGTDEDDQGLDVDEFYSNWSTQVPFSPYFMLEYRLRRVITPALQTRRGGDENRIFDLNNVNVVLTSDKSKWSRCVVVETFQTYHAQSDFGPAIDGRSNWELRAHPSVGRNDADGDGEADEDGEGLEGMGWFPGYAVDVETGERLNIFFGENSMYSLENLNLAGVLPDSVMTGGDLMWNPDNLGIPTLAVQLQQPPFAEAVINHGNGMHMIYVTNQPYDSCNQIRALIEDGDENDVAKLVRWASFPAVAAGTELLPLGNGETGLIPNDVTIRLRAQNPFQVSEDKWDFNGYPTYNFTFEGQEPVDKMFAEGESVLDEVLVVPNPYYGFSAYETQPTTGVVKITNLPAVCTVSIFTLDGKFIRRFERNETPVLVDEPTAAVTELGISPAIEWDLENFAQVPVTSGVYLIHIEAPGIGEKVLKWFGVKRRFNPSSN